MAPRKNAQSTPAELSLVHLRNCLVNLPSSLVSLLVNINTPAQNVVVELSYRTPPTGGAPSAAPQSIFVGWTGMPSKRKVTPVVGRDGINGIRGNPSSRDQDIGLVEIDATLANTLGLTDGQKITASIHVDPPLVHTINLEPLTPEDWEIIELHATFLELNLLSQVRALPNPAFKSASGQPVPAHALTLHLSPTSTARIKTISLDPPPPADYPFAKISPDAEVIVAPKTRPKTTQSSSENRSVASTSKSRRSGTSSGRKKSTRERKNKITLRGVDRNMCLDWFEEEVVAPDFSIWVDHDLLHARGFNGVNYVLVTVLRESGSVANTPRPQADDPAPVTSHVATKVVAHLRAWDDPPDNKPAALSSPLCAALGFTGMVGGIIEIEAASQPVGRDAVQKLAVYPFATSKKTSEGLKFGSESKAEREEAAKTFRHIYAGSQKASSLLAGPLTDGTLFGLYDGLESPQGWEGGVIKFEPAPSSPDSKEPGRWTLGISEKTPIEFQAPIPRPAWMTEDSIAEPLPSYDGLLVSIDKLLLDLQSHLSNLSTSLLTGASGSGKTSVAKYVAQRLREDSFFHTTYFSCKKLVNNESRMASIRSTLNQLFLTASWGAKFGGKAVIILDDLDTSCPAETELQTTDNGRSRQVSEIISSMARQYCSVESGVVLLATAEGKEALNEIIVGANVFREVLELKAPNKDARRQVLEAIVKQEATSPDNDAAPSHDGSRPTTADGSAAAEDSNWMDGASQGSRENTTRQPGRFILDSDLDFLDIAGLTDGYMPKDLSVVIERAQNEAVIRSVDNSSKPNAKPGPIRLTRLDFDNALKDFTPTSLRDVSLQSSTTTFSSIGGLQETRQVLLETLLYPTKYAPVFEKCPLRLRSGLLLYGYPGCGKTLLASAVAGECGLNFISVKGPEILNKYIGASEKSVRDLFERASAAKPSVLFFDEFDSIAPKRGHDSTGVTDRVVNQLLTLMDGAEGLSGVYVLAATSRPDLIDPALLRPGRLDKSLLCDLPTLEDRVDILKALSQQVKLDPEMSESDEAWTEIARRCEAFSGADLQGLISNAQLEAIHDVLQDDSHNEPVANGKTNGVHKAESVPSFVHFPYCEPEEPSSTSLIQPNKFHERAAIMAKFEGIKQARKRARHAQQPEAVKAAVEDKEVVVGWKHLVKALVETKASISAQERNRLKRIYHEFVVGRSGEMKDGQPSMEIGGRSSLM
ncbi:Peroxisome biosynthesis protein PAS1 like [Verticillium longisporum]|uniref:Peroxisomal ATPase PEX1 n=1 Tax=Verticillium longisporum TaxID=100787 RepID=A0A8I3ARD5_VERLO|nr:Peroxisome biosynthesis protein PAS1 like [Verticillium longisporum]